LELDSEIANKRILSGKEAFGLLKGLRNFTGHQTLFGKLESIYV